MSIDIKKDYPPAVIVGLNDASLCIIRSLGIKGIRIIGIYDDTTQGYYTNSRYIYKKFKSHTHDKQLIKTLIEDVTKTLKEPAVLFCASDISVLTISKYADQLSPFLKFVLPPYEMTSSQISKKGFYRFACDNSFLVPKTFFSVGKEEIEHITEEISFPCIIKPEYRDLRWSERVPFKVLYAKSKADFCNLINKYNIQHTSLVIQEWIEGEDSEVYFCLFYMNRHSKPLALCMGRKLRQYPHLTGSTSVAETIWIPEIADESLRLLTAARYVGFCSVEFKKSKTDGKFYITEPTVGRPDTQEGICLGAGIDIPYIAYLDAIEQDVRSVTDFKVGIKWINEPHEFYSIQKTLRNSFNIRSFLSIYKGNRTYALWNRNDPKPALTFINEKIVKGISKLYKPLFRGKSLNNK
jgi:predicted ATP-grasp superfamily ATP-dependent carboligase